MSTSSVWFSTLPLAERQELAALEAAPLLHTPDVLVVGGGLVGLATAYYAAQRGMRVQVLEAGPLAGAASGANAGGICPNLDGNSYPEGYLPLALLSRDLWGRLSVRPGFEFDWRVPGFLQVDPAAFRFSAVEFMRTGLEQGLSLQAVDAGQLALLEPNLRADLTEGVYYPSEGHLHPVRAALSLARGIRAFGGQVRCKLPALRLEVAGGRVTAVETSAGRIEPGPVVIATGWNAAWLRDLLPLPWPIVPVSGQMLFTAPLPPLLNRPIGGKFVIFQLRTGEVATGGHLRDGALADPDADLSREIQAAAEELVPALRGVPFEQAWCGVRPATADGMPIIDRLPSADNLFFNGGHFKKGVLLAPASGKLLADWLASGTRPVELDCCAWRRFAHVG